MARLTVCVAAVAAVTALLSALPLSDQPLYSALTFLLIVVTVSAVWGFRHAVFASFVSALAFGYLVPPAGRFEIDDPRDWFALTAFLVVGIIASRLSERARGEALRARQAEAAARRSAKELQDAIETIPAMAWIGLPDGSNAFVNRRWGEYTGLSAEESAGSGWRDVVHPDDIEHYVRKWQESVQTGVPLEDEVRFRRASNGEYRWFLVRAVGMRDEHGTIVKWFGIVTDIEEHKRTEQALRRSEAYLAEAQRLTHTGSWAVDYPTGNTVYWSEETFRICGIDPQQGLPDYEASTRLVHPEDRDSVATLIGKAFREKADYAVEYRLMLHDGTVKHVRIIGHPVFDRAGEIREYIGTAVDVTERKRAEDAAVQSAAMLREQARLLDLTHDTIFVRDLNDVITYWNRGAEELYGWGREEAIGQVTHELLHTIFPEPLERITTALHRAGRWEGELVHTKRDGKPVTVASRWSLQRDESGRPTGTLETNNDITGRKRAEAERERLRQLQADLARVNRVTTMGELTASLAHEVNQPIAAAITDASTCLRWLSRDEPDLDEARAAAKRTVKDATRAADIISRMRAPFKQSAPEPELVHVNELIAEMVTLVRSEATRHGVSIRTDLAVADFPHILGDRVQLQQVLLNLMMNSIEAMKEVDGPRELTLMSRRDGSADVLISVIDTGVGLPPNTDELFKAFVTTKPEGTGMGLAISRSIVESHGGRVWAAANAGSGATFSFTLPAATA